MLEMPEILGFYSASA